MLFRKGMYRLPLRIIEKWLLDEGFTYSIVRGV